MSEMAIKLERMVIDEVSAVGPDFGGGPANLLDGAWLVVKSRDGADETIGHVFPAVTAVNEIAACVEKARSHTPALADPPPTAERGGETALQVYKHENGAWAVTMPDCKTVRVFSGRGGSGVSVLKSDIEDAETRAIEPGLGFAPAAEVAKLQAEVLAKEHHSRRQIREQGRFARGSFKGSFFKPANTRPKLAGTTFFT